MSTRPPSDSLLTRARSPLRTSSGEPDRVRCDGARPTDTRHLLPWWNGEHDGALPEPTTAPSGPNSTARRPPGGRHPRPLLLWTRNATANRTVAVEEQQSPRRIDAG